LSWLTAVYRLTHKKNPEKNGECFIKLHHTPVGRWFYIILAIAWYNPLSSLRQPEIKLVIIPKIMKLKLPMPAIVIATCFYIASAHAQEFSLKKDVILKDKVPYAKLTGESSLFKDTDLLVSSLNGHPLFTIKTWKYPTGNPAYKALKGVKIEFKASGKSLIRTTTAYAKSKLVEELFHFWSDLVVNNAIDPKAEADYISKFDNNEVVAHNCMKRRSRNT